MPPAPPVWYRTARQARMRRCAARVARPVTGRVPSRPTTGRETGHRPQRSRACRRSGPRLIGGKVFGHRAVDFTLGRSMYVLSAGKLACPGCAAPLRRGWLRVATQRAEPLRAAATVGTYARDPMLGTIPRWYTPASRRRRGDGATRRRTRSAVCCVAARLASDLLVHRRAAPGTRPAGVRLGVPSRTAAGGPRQHTHGPDTMHTNDPGRHTVDAHPDVAYVVIPSGCTSWRASATIGVCGATWRGNFIRVSGQGGVHGSREFSSGR